MHTWGKSRANYKVLSKATLKNNRGKKIAISLVMNKQTIQVAVGQACILWTNMPNVSANITVTQKQWAVYEYIV